MISGHTMCLGISKGGKSSAAIEFINWYKKSGYEIQLLSTFKNGMPCDEFFRSNPHDVRGSAREFIKRAREKRNRLLVVDDARDTLDKHDSASIWLGSQSRHWGHSYLIITQRIVDVHPSIRNNAESAILFKQSKKDCDTLYEDFVDEEVLRATKLKKYHFLVGGKYQPFVETKFNL